MTGLEYAAVTGTAAGLGLMVGCLAGSAWELLRLRRWAQRQ